MNRWSFIVSVSSITLATFAACRNTTESSAPPRPTLNNNQTVDPGTLNTTATLASNRPPLVGAQNPVILLPGQKLTGEIQASDPDSGDQISRIEFVTEPAIMGFTGITVPVGQGDRHPFSISVPTNPGFPGTMGYFVVYDSRGGSTRVSFALTFSASQPGTTLPSSAGGLTDICNQLAANIKSDNAFVAVGTVLLGQFGCSMLGSKGP
jgi:hypothetical protein